MWKTVRLGDVCKIVNGSTPLRSNPRYWDTGKILWFTIEDLRKQGRDIYTTNQKVTYEAVKEASLKVVPINTVLLCCTASVGEVAIARSKMATNQQFNALIPLNDNLVPEYLYYVSTTLKNKLLSLSGRTTINFIPISKLKNIEISLPPLQQQKQIVKKLDATFAEIDKNIENLKNKKEQVESLVNRVLEEELKNTEGENVKLEDVCLNITDGSHFSPKTDEEGFPYITVRDINDDEIDFANCKFISKESYLELAKNGCSPSEGDVLFSKDGTVGKVAEVKTKKDFAVLSSLAILTPNKNFVTTELLAYILKSQSFLKEAIGQKTGAAIRRIILKNLKKISFKLPSLAHQHSIVSKLDAVNLEKNTSINVLNSQIDNYIALKSSILSNSLKGPAL